MSGTPIFRFATPNIRDLGFVTCPVTSRTNHTDVFALFVLTSAKTDLPLPTYSHCRGSPTPKRKGDLCSGPQNVSPIRHSLTPVRVFLPPYLPSPAVHLPPGPQVRAVHGSNLLGLRGTHAQEVHGCRRSTGPAGPRVQTLYEGDTRRMAKRRLRVPT